MLLCTVHILHLKCALCLRCIKKFKATHAQRRAVPNTLRYPFFTLEFRFAVVRLYELLFAIVRLHNSCMTCNCETSQFEFAVVRLRSSKLQM